MSALRIGKKGVNVTENTATSIVRCRGESAAHTGIGHACGTTQVQAWNHAEVDRGGQQRGENIGYKMVIEGGQGTSSLVIYMKDLVEVTKLRMGRRLFRTTAYEWNR